MITEKQLEIEMPIATQDSDNYRAVLSEYKKDVQAGKKNTFLCYCHSTMKYFVSRFFSKEGVESFKIKIIQ